MLNKKRPKVLVVIERFYPLVGGAETQCLQVCSGLKNKGYGISIVTKRWHKEYASSETVGKDKLLVYRLGVPGFSRISDYLCGIFLANYLIVERNNYQILFVDSGIANIFASTAILIGKILSKKVVVKVETPGELIFSGPKALSPKKFVHPLIKLRLYLSKKGDCYIAQTEEMKEELVSLGIKRELIWSFPNSVDENLFKPMPGELKKRALRQKLYLPKEKIIVMFCGRLVVRKGLIFLLRAWKEVVNKSNEGILVLVGSGRNQPDTVEEQLKKFVKENSLSDKVIFVGEKNKLEVIEYLQAADIFMHPSIHPEGRSLSVLEAMSSGLPVIVSNIGGLKEIVTDKVNGFLVEKENPKQLAQAINKLLHSELLRKKFGNEGRKEIIKKFSLSQSVKINDQLLSSMI